MKNKHVDNAITLPLVNKVEFKKRRNGKAHGNYSSGLERDYHKDPFFRSHPATQSAHSCIGQLPGSAARSHTSSK